MKKSSRFIGIGVSHGVALGPALVVGSALAELRDLPMFAPDLSKEDARLEEAIQKTKARLLELRDRTEQRAGAEEAKIFDAQILMLEDEEFLSSIKCLIRENSLTAERAFEFVSLELRQLWSQSSSPLLRQKTTDLLAITDRILNYLMGKPGAVGLTGLTDEPCVVITKELTPGLTVEFDREHVAAFVSEEGTRTSHAAILARSLEIPCVMGLATALSQIKSGDKVIVDGATGVVIVSPSKAEIKQVHARHEVRQPLERELELGGDEPAATLDGTPITLRGNLDLPEELDSLANHGAEGVGLMRTEFLVLGRPALPSEDEQYQFFRRVAERFPGHPLIIRSYDLGGDKLPTPSRPPPDPNPFLGWRAIRVCLDEPELFKTQIRALLRARRHGDVQLMLPLVTGIGELDESIDLVNECKSELRRDGVEAAADLPVGVMVETPSAVMIAPELAKSSSFLSVGTNDLTQYTLAVDRANARLASRFVSLHPAIVRMLKQVLVAAADQSIPASVCGELASDPLGVVLLIGLGYRVLSVSPASLQMVRWLVRQIDTQASREAADKALLARTSDEVSNVLRDVITQYVDTELLNIGWLPMRIPQSSLKV